MAADHEDSAGDHKAATGAPAHRLRRRSFLGLAGVAVGAAALVPVVVSRLRGGNGPAWTLPDFTEQPPFSFTYGGMSSRDLLPSWEHEHSTGSFEHGSETVDSWNDPQTRLRVVLTTQHHDVSGTVSWLVRFINDGSAQSPQLSDVLALDLVHQIESLRPWTLHTNNGSDAQDVDFAPLDVPLPDGAFRVFSTANGRPSDGVNLASISIPWSHRAGEATAANIGGDQHATTVAGATAALAFEGTSIAWIGARDVEGGQADVLIDGEQVATVDQYAASRETQVELFSAADLTDGQHTIVVRSRAEANPASSGTNVNIDAFVVGTGSDAETINDSDPRIEYGGNEAEQPTYFRTGWPYLNIDWGGEGLILAIGWPGQWALQAERSGSELRVCAGMTQRDALDDGARIQEAELADLWLAPGEEIRTPRIVALPWQGVDHHEGQNAWRQWFVDEHMPRLDGDPVPPLCPTQSNDYFPGQWDTADDQLTWLNAYRENGASPSTGGNHDHWWIDAGWYDIPEGAEEMWNWPGTWFPDPDRYPDGLKPTLDLARELGMRTIVWFEPERVRMGTWLHVNHPEWLLNIPDGVDNFLLDFGNPEARDWAITTIGDMIVNDGIDVYREDFNIGPLPLWRANDPEGRRGITQIRYVDGHLAYWKALLERSPGLVIDTCASGGRRMDVESLGLSVNLLRSDRVLDATANQTHMHGVSSWVPLHGGVVRITGGPDDWYDARSAYSPSTHHALDVRQQDAPWDTLKATAAEWKELSEYLYGNYYPLTPGGAAPDAVIAWQLSERDGSAGYVQAFRRRRSGQNSMLVRFRGLQPEQQYTVTDRDSGAEVQASGSDLMDGGYALALDDAPSAKVLMFAAS